MSSVWEVNLYVRTEAEKMNFPQLDSEVMRKRHARAIKQLRVGDIVEGWLDCIPDPGCTRPLPIVILKTPGLREVEFKVKSLFSEEAYDVYLGYQWKCVGHIDGLAELLAAEEAAHVYAQIARSNDTSLSAVALEPR